MTDAPDVDDRRDTPLADQPASLGETPTLVFQGDDATREPQTTGLIGQVIDARYRVLERLAGDDGAVYLAEHMRLSKQVVLKTISATAFGRDDAFARFEREARVTAVLDHPHIVCVMDYGRLDDGGAYLITQLVRGQSLTALLDAGPLSWPLACDIAVQIADALAAAHERGIVHRDLSPDNVMLERTSDDRQFARVVNFGIARIVNDAAGVPGGREALTRIGVVLGNPGYMAPEQAVGGEVDARADLYALGVMLWESITGRRLWPAPDLTALFKLQLTRDPPPLAELVPGVPEELSKLVAGLLQRDVDARSSSASELCATLRRLVSEAGP
ncbi:MAG: serine/threonine protein kinase, partial [Myxococcales bacterium]|nr:serine/threonine protein kinase [Myxococcales bacterium]